MNRHLYIHNEKYKRKGDLYMLFMMLFTVIGVLSFIAFLIPVEELASDIPYQISQSP